MTSSFVAPRPAPSAKRPETRRERRRKVIDALVDASVLASPLGSDTASDDVLDEKAFSSNGPSEPTAGARFDVQRPPRHESEGFGDPPRVPQPLMPAGHAVPPSLIERASNQSHRLAPLFGGADGKIKK